MKKQKTYQQEIGDCIARLRKEKDLTQSELADLVGTSQPAIARLEAGDQNISLEMIKKLGSVLDAQILSINDTASQSFRVNGGKELHGEITVNTSKNAAVALLCASLLNSGKTTLHRIARIEEVFRIIEVLESIGVKCRWKNRHRDLEIIPPHELKLGNLDLDAARKTRSIIMFMGPLLHKFNHFRLPYAGGCDLGVRTIDPHLRALSTFGLSVDAISEIGFYNATVRRNDNSKSIYSSSMGAHKFHKVDELEEKQESLFEGMRSYDEHERQGPVTTGALDAPREKTILASTSDMSQERTALQASCQTKRIVLIERGDTVTENVLMAAALYPGKTEIIGASPNYMVQDVCFFLEKLGVKIDGIGTTTLKVRGVEKINKDVEYYPSEDPIEAMSFIAAALVTKSEITITRAPIEFLEIELEVLKSMNARIDRSDEYFSNNHHTRLVDLTIKKSDLIAPTDKIHPMPFPGLNIDNLPFFSVISATAKGRTMIHDWVFENRAIYATELTRLNANIELLDAHRLYVEGPTNWRPAELVAPPALRPAVVILIAMLAAPGTSILRNVYPINRGYQDFARRLVHLGADVTPISGI